MSQVCRFGWLEIASFLCFFACPFLAWGETFEQVDKLVQSGIDEGKMPGCVLCVGRHDQILLLKAYGNKRIEPNIEPMTIDTVFDMASITKPVATATSVMKLLEQGKVSLSDKIATILPEFAQNGKESLTILDLLVHRSGLIADNAMKDYEDGPKVAWDRICSLRLVTPVGTAFKYSDVNFIVLGKVVEKLSGVGLDVFAEQNLFAPMGMKQTGYHPNAELRARAAPTEKRDGNWMQGEVHDPRAHALGGVAGHAGLFSTANDIAIYAQMMLNRGLHLSQTGEAAPILSPSTVDVMTRSYSVPGGVRGLGWDKQSTYSINRGDLLSPSAFGHGGFTGNVLWIDPEKDLFFIFLSNRVHPNGKGLVNPLAGKILNAVVTEVASANIRIKPLVTPVLTGIDVLERDHFRVLKGQRVGLITNHTGRNRKGISTVQILRSAKEVELKILFSPEHGFEGKLDTEKISHSKDEATGLKILSLYGESRRPTAEMLSDIDTIVFDIQDIGTRFYTYISTMGEAMAAATEHKRKFVVLDRPNPINGIAVTGPMLDPKAESFVGFHRIPVRHGMTIGELAKMFRDELKLDLDLQVIPCEGWKRSDHWEQTGLVWVNPSPNMRSLNQALLYPGIGLLETTNLSVGRGTDTPFEQIGAPWINGQELAMLMNQHQLPGVAFIPVEFTPTASKFSNQQCFGINIAITDRNALQPIEIGLTLAATLRRQYPDAWETKSLNRLLGNETTYKLLLDGKSGSDIMPAVSAGVSDFLRRRDAFLIYR
jgi:uncharacterized protein YbbC (DUF1343 family)/CubicO group peptidase (beta-lactamase class C family)